MTRKSFHTTPANHLQGEMIVAADKSISHRALILSALATGNSSIQNLLMSEDVLCTMKVLQQLGVGIESDPPACGTPLNKGGWGDLCEGVTITGSGFSGLKSPTKILHCGNSGTTMRLMLGVLAGAGIAAELTGDASLNQRPMERVLTPLTEMGARFEVTPASSMRVIKTLAHDGLHGREFVLPMASAQVKSALLLAGLNADGETIVTEPVLSRNHTEIMLATMGACLKVSGTTTTISRVTTLLPCAMTIPGDFSSAAFFVVAALVMPGSDVLIRQVNLNPTRTGLLDVLLEMGANITVLNRRLQSGEWVGDLHIKTSALRNVKVGGKIIPRLIDEIPILALAAAFAKGDLVLSDASELRVKESDRIRAVCREYGKLGVDIIERPDGFIVAGGRALKLRDKNVSAHGDHRIAMSLVIAGLFCNDSFTIDDVSSVATSFPDFFTVLESLRG